MEAEPMARLAAELSELVELEEEPVAVPEEDEESDESVLEASVDSEPEAEAPALAVLSELEEEPVAVALEPELPEPLELPEELSVSLGVPLEVLK